MPFNLFKKKPPQPEQSAPTPQPEPQPEAPAQPQETPQQPAPQPQEPTEQPVAPAPTQETTEPAPEPPKETEPTTTEEKPAPAAETAPSKTYLKAMPLRELADLDSIKSEVTNGNIIILRVTPLAGKSIEDVKTAVNDLFQFADSIGGDIARLGEERVVITPKTVRIWREKTPAPVTSSQPLPTAA